MKNLVEIAALLLCSENDFLFSPNSHFVLKIPETWTGLRVYFHVKDGNNEGLEKAIMFSSMISENYTPKNYIFQTKWQNSHSFAVFLQDFLLQLAYVMSVGQCVLEGLFLISCIISLSYVWTIMWIFHRSLARIVYTTNNFVLRSLKPMKPK